MDSYDIYERRRRRRIQQQKIRRRRFYTFLIVLAVIAVIFAIFKLSDLRGPEAQPQPSESSQPETMTNDVVFPEKPEVTADILTAQAKEDGVKTCYLTFDDGPTNSVTPRILDTLRRYNIKATFFMVGSLIEDNSDMARRVYEEGHFLANHSYGHNYSKLYANQDDFMNEFNTTYKLITDVTGNLGYAKIFRFPGGGYNAGSYGAAKQEYKEILKSNNVRYCDWNALNGDAEGGSPTVEQLIERVKKTTKNKEDVVILMHDAAAKSTTADALPSIVEYLIGQGYTFKRLDQAPII